MQKAVAKEGPRAPLFCLAAALLLLSAKIAVAQSVDLSSLEVCANLETPELKLACFEAIIAGARPTGEPVPETAVAVTPENKPAVLEVESAVASEPVIAAAAARARVAAAVVPENEPETPPAANQTESDATEDPAPPEVTPVTSVTPSTEDFGREQLAEPDQDGKKEVIRAVVVNVTQGHNRTLYFHLANGHTWRQIEPRRLQYPKDREFEIQITQGVMGDYRLRIGDNGRMVRIRRVQ